MHTCASFLDLQKAFNSVDLKFYDKTKKKFWEKRKSSKIIKCNHTDNKHYRLQS